MDVHAGLEAARESLGALCCCSLAVGLTRELTLGGGRGIGEEALEVVEREEGFGEVD